MGAGAPVTGIHLSGDYKVGTERLQYLCHPDDLAMYYKCKSFEYYQ